LSTKDKKESVNIFDLLSEVPDVENKKKSSRRTELLKSIGVKDNFKEGTIKIDMRKCRGIECNLCVKLCPTNALYWKAGEIGIIEDLCVHCTACVANCMEDDCIEITRKRFDNITETFSNPKDVIKLQNRICSKKRKKRVKSIYPTLEKYFERHK
jgi:ferredoxin